MKEFVFVEFLFTDEEVSEELDKLADLGNEFQYIKSNYEWESDTDLSTPDKEYVRVSGRISSETASFIMLQNPALAGKMRISYISEELKNKYRR
ncbi:MAG TPA: hypothetical protein VIY47_01430 [Ignavibacteriaceae bacterium]